MSINLVRCSNELTMQQYWGEAEGRWDSVAGELRAARGSLAAGALHPRHASKIRELVKELEQRLHASQWAGAGPRVAVIEPAPSFRRALLAASDEIVATNDVLCPPLTAYLRGGPAWPGLKEVIEAADVLQSAAVFLLTSTKLYKQAWDGDDLQPRVASASVAIMGAGGLLFELAAAGHIWARDLAPEGGGAEGRKPAADAPPVRVHRVGLEKMVDYLDGMAYAGWRGGGLERLRATTHSPAAILACLRRLVQEPPSIDFGLDFIKIIFCANTIFSEERTALEADPQLLKATIDHLESGLHRVAATAASLSRAEKAAAFHSATNVATALTTWKRFGDRGAGFLERATRSPDLLAAAEAVLDACLADPPAEDLSNDVQTLGYMWAECARSTLNLMHNVLTQVPGPPGPVAAGQLLGFLRRGVAVATVLDERSAKRGIPEIQDDSLRSLNMILDGLVGEGGHRGSARGDAAFLGTVLAPRRCALEGLCALDGLLRLAARVPGRAAGMFNLEPHDRAVHKARMNLLPLLEHGLAGHVLPVAGTADGLAAVAGVVDALAELALRLAALPAAAFAKMANEIRANLLASAANFMSRVMEGLPRPAQAMPDHDALRRLQAMALAACPAVAALEGCRNEKAAAAGLAMRGLLLKLTSWPEVFSLVVQSEAGGPAVARTLELALKGERGEVDLRHVHAAATGPGGAEVAAALARLGTLTQLARRAELRCRAGGATQQQGALAEIVEVVGVACAASKAVAVAAGCSRLAIEHGPAAETRAAFWAELAREVTAPLAAELAARAAAEPPPLQVAVDVAQALATRRCARLACTTTTAAAPSEAAAPRNRRCSGCRVVRYCCRDCQKADWPAHKAACRELQARRAAEAPQGPASP